MKRIAALSIAGLVALSACSDESLRTPLSPEGALLSESSERVGTEKPLPGEVTSAATVSVTDIFSGGTSPADMAQSLAGAGVTIQNVTYQGTTRSGGKYTNGAGTIGFDGTILSSGFAIDVLGPNTSTQTSRSLGTPGDPDLNAISGFTTLDATVLSFEVVPDADKVYFEYVFSSEEYQEYVNSSFNDSFGFFINGQNCAVIGAPPEPITVNNINHLVNTHLFRNNYPPPGTIDIEPDGLTTTLVCEASVNPGVANTVKLAIADASDRILDSWVFIKAGSFSTTPPANTAPVLDPIADQIVDEGSAVGFTATASDADDPAQTLTYSLIGAPAGASIHSATGVFSWTPTDDDPTATPSDAHTFTVRVTDDGTGALSDEQEVTITVNNVAPTITSLSAPTEPIELASGSATAPVSVSFTDPGSGDTHTTVIACGNSTDASGGTCTYDAAGVYTITATVTDDDTGSDSETYQYVVVYDPASGFVTGGGWIDSPAGAYAADASLSGKANFGFVSKYKKGASVPDGQTQFQFHAASFNFHSTDYQWLVISGPKAQYKGSGTINGSGDYGFLLTANDGQVSGGGGVDRFRLKIWDKTTNAVIYDNQVGDADDAAASDAIEGGSIVIHSK